MRTRRWDAKAWFDQHAEAFAAYYDTGEIDVETGRREDPIVSREKHLCIPERSLRRGSLPNRCEDAENSMDELTPDPDPR